MNHCYCRAEILDIEPRSLRFLWISRRRQQKGVIMRFANYQTLEFAYRGRVLTITLNRPEKLNAVDAVMHEELARVFVDASSDPDSDIVVLTGAGRAFSSGG